MNLYKLNNITTYNQFRTSLFAKSEKSANSILLLFAKNRCNEAIPAI